MKKSKIFGFILFFLIFIAIDVGAATRIALVIGNSKYQSSPLKNPANDANAIADILRACGFTDSIFDHQKHKGDVGTMSRSLIRQIESLWLFLDIVEVEPTNNFAERTLRFGVLWRKRSKGTQSEKGNLWVERILSFKQTCSIRSLNSFPILVEIIDSYFKEQKPDLSWI